MSARRQRMSAIRLMVIIALLMIIIWLLYRFYLQVPPAPVPPVRRAERIVTVHTHA